MQFPVIVTKGKDEEKVFHAPDLKGWLDAGWEIKEDKPEPKKRGPKPQESKPETKTDLDLDL